MEIILNNDKLDELIDSWHEDNKTTLSLHEYLGMTWEEYSVWVMRPSVLPLILSSREKGVSLADELNKERLAPDDIKAGLND